MPVPGCCGQREILASGPGRRARQSCRPQPWQFHLHRHQFQRQSTGGLHCDRGGRAAAGDAHHAAGVAAGVVHGVDAVVVPKQNSHGRGLALQSCDPNSLPTLSTSTAVDIVGCAAAVVVWACGASLPGALGAAAAMNAAARVDCDGAEATKNAAARVGSAAVAAAAAALATAAMLAAAAVEHAAAAGGAAAQPIAAEAAAERPVSSTAPPNAAASPVRAGALASAADAWAEVDVAGAGAGAAGAEVAGSSTQQRDRTPQPCTPVAAASVIALVGLQGAKHRCLMERRVSTMPAKASKVQNAAVRTVG